MRGGSLWDELLFWLSEDAEASLSWPLPGTPSGSRGRMKGNKKEPENTVLQGQL